MGQMECVNHRYKMEQERKLREESPFIKDEEKLTEDCFVNESADDLSEIDDELDALLDEYDDDDRYEGEDDFFGGDDYPARIMESVARGVERVEKVAKVIVIGAAAVIGTAIIATIIHKRRK